MAFGLPPFYDRVLPIMYKNIKSKQISFPEPKSGKQGISDEMKDLIKRVY